MFDTKADDIQTVYIIFQLCEALRSQCAHIWIRFFVCLSFGFCEKLMLVTEGAVEEVFAT